MSGPSEVNDYDVPGPRNRPAVVFAFTNFRSGEVPDADWQWGLNPASGCAASVIGVSTAQPDSPSLGTTEKRPTDMWVIGAEAGSLPLGDSDPSDVGVMDDNVAGENQLMNGLTNYVQATRQALQGEEVIVGSNLRNYTDRTVQIGEWLWAYSPNVDPGPP